MKSLFSIFNSTESWLKKSEVTFESFDEVSSTNDFAKEEAFSISSPLKVYLANKQTLGRGRGENQWLSPDKDHGLMISFSFDMGKPPQPITGPLIGLAVYRSLVSTFSLKNSPLAESELSIKPPNDIFKNQDKVAGILIETLQMGEKNRLIIGLGVNVRSAPKSVESAGVLFAESSSLVQTAWEQFLTELLHNLKLGAQGAMASHLNNDEREDLLTAINKNPLLEEKCLSISPFGDLSTNSKTQSWRSL